MTLRKIEKDKAKIWFNIMMHVQVVNTPYKSLKIREQINTTTMSLDKQRRLLISRMSIKGYNET